ncbi:hypothetical protein WJX81_003157 [Elliptochloris bilobata]|uniref:GAF domain-containing protein n=1 Tax=Elliptochloris bilobata TaxID=381761 RepID=A0AAW1RJE1_9CHLO
MALQVEEGQADPVLDSLCNLVCSLLKVRIAGVSIVERDRQFYKALSGHAKLTIPRAWSFCQYTFLPKLPTVLVVEDAAKDERFDAHPLVVGGDALPIRFYAGAPLITSTGHRIGAMCLVDTQPRRLTVDDYRVLNNCAEMVVRRLEADQFAVAHAGAAHQLLRSLEAYKRAVLLCDMSSRGWRILYANEPWSKATGLKQVDARQYTVWDLYQAAEESQDAAVAGFADAVANEQPFSLAMQLRSAGARAPVLHFVFRPATSGALDPFAVDIAIPEGVPR